MASQSGRPKGKSRDVEEGLADDAFLDWMATFYDDPLGFVREVYPWGQEGTLLANETGPDEWQVEWLTRLGNEVKLRATAAEAMASLRMSTVSGNGTGKTTLTAWVIQWFISTRAHALIRVTANTATQLSTADWRELAKWHNMMIHKDLFEWTATKYTMRAFPETWFAVAIPWSKENPSAFQGGHDVNIMYLFDEAQGIHDTIWDAVEGSMTTHGAMWFAFGNGTKSQGAFRETHRKFRNMWILFNIDARRAKMANKVEHAQWLASYGEDSDFYRARVLGEFVRSSTNQLISPEAVEACQKRFARMFPDAKRVLAEGGVESLFREVVLDPSGVAPKILSVDVARFGIDQTVVGLRIGKVFLILAKYRELDVTQVSGRVAEWIEAVSPDAVFVDEAGIGGGVVDILNDMGHDVTGVNGGLKAINDRRYFNRRAEMWDKTKDWLRGDVCLDDDRELMDDLTGPEYGFSDRGDRIQLETKDDMRARGLPSPDSGDCLTQTFFIPVAARERGQPSVQDRILELAAGRSAEGRSWQSY